MELTEVASIALTSCGSSTEVYLEAGAITYPFQLAVEPDDLRYHEGPAQLQLLCDYISVKTGS